MAIDETTGRELIQVLTKREGRTVDFLGFRSLKRRKTWIFLKTRHRR